MSSGLRVLSTNQRDSVLLLPPPPPQPSNSFLGSLLSCCELFPIFSSQSRALEIHNSRLIGALPSPGSTLELHYVTGSARLGRQLQRVQCSVESSSLSVDDAVTDIRRRARGKSRPPLSLLIFTPLSSPSLQTITLPLYLPPVIKQASIPARPLPHLPTHPAPPPLLPSPPPYMSSSTPRPVKATPAVCGTNRSPQPFNPPDSPSMCSTRNTRAMPN